MKILDIISFGIPVCLLAGSLVSPARADVTLTYDNTTDPAEAVWILENDKIAVTISDVAGARKGRVKSLVKKTGPGTGGNQSAPGTSYSYYDRVSTRASTLQSLFEDLDNPGTPQSRSLVVTESNKPTGKPEFAITKIYTLRDHENTLEVHLKFENLGVDYLDMKDGLSTLAYIAPGGSAPAGDNVFVKTVNGLDAAGSGNTLWGQDLEALTGRPELAEAWAAGVDSANGVINAITWDLPTQKQFSKDGISSTKVFRGGDRFQIEPLYTSVPAGGTVDFTTYFIVDDGVPVVSYAAYNSLIAGVSTDSFGYSRKSTINAQIQLNSTKTTDASWDVKNIRLTRADGTGTDITFPDITGVAVAAGAHVTHDLTSTAPATAPEGTYRIKADVYPAGGSTRLTTLISQDFDIVADKVILVETTPGSWLLENEVLQVMIDPKGEITQYNLKTAENRNQVDMTYNLFRDYTKPAGGLHGFSVKPETLSTANPSGTDSSTKKSVAITGLASADGTLNKTYTLESMSRSLKADLVYTNVNPAVDPLLGGGYYPQSAFRPGGTTGAADVFSAKSATGLLTPHTASTNFWFGAIDQADGTVKVGDSPELTEPWMAGSDTTLTDAIAVSWNLADQKAHSLVPTDGSGTDPVTSNKVYVSGGYGRLAVESHFTNILSTTPLTTTMYAMGDTGFKLVSYAEGMRVMAGIWSNQDDAVAGTVLSANAAVSNVGTTNRTFDLKNFRLVKDTGEATPAGADQTGIALTPSQRSDKTLAVTIPAGLAAGSYTLQADLYEGATKVSTLITQAVNITAAALPASGDVNGDTNVNAADVTLALQIAGGLATADSGNIARGDINADGAITVDDATAIARKAAQ
jgi:hypothetical protein